MEKLVSIAKMAGKSATEGWTEGQRDSVALQSWNQLSASSWGSRWPGSIANDQRLSCANVHVCRQMSGSELAMLREHFFLSLFNDADWTNMWKSSDHKGAKVIKGAFPFVAEAEVQEHASVRSGIFPFGRRYSLIREADCRGLWPDAGGSHGSSSWTPAGPLSETTQRPRPCHHTSCFSTFLNIQKKTKKNHPIKSRLLVVKAPLSWG